MRIAQILACLFLGGCASPGLDQLSRQLPTDTHLQALNSAPLMLLAAKQPAAGGQRLRIYIEGDGRAWITRYKPSLDPTPHSTWFAQLAMDDPQPSLWLARPCQYIKSPNCNVRHWTNERFSQEVIDSFEQALDQLKMEYGNTQFELVGYSGGAAVALLLAARRNDIHSVYTLAGNLSPQRWTEQLRLSPLSGSLEPSHYKAQLRHIPQRHLSGAEDKVIPSNLALDWQQTLASPCLEVISLPSVDHHTGWAQAWRQWRTQPAPEGC